MADDVKKVDKSVVLSDAERKVVLDALDMYAKSMDRAQRGATTVEIARAYNDAAESVRQVALKFR